MSEAAAAEQPEVSARQEAARQAANTRRLRAVKVPQDLIDEVLYHKTAKQEPEQKEVQESTE